MKKTYRKLESFVDDAFVWEIFHVVLQKIFLDTHHCVAKISDHVEVLDHFITELIDVIRPDVLVKLKEVLVYEIPLVVDEDS